MSLLRTLRGDVFVLAIIATVFLASVLPVSAGAAPALDHVVAAAIALLFFLYGARMHPREALDGLKHWRLHTLILLFTFVAFPLVGMALRVLEPSLLSPTLYAGLLYLTLVPSTVQSSIAFTSIARGNVGGAIVSASASNLLGIVLTPLLVVTMTSLHLLGGNGEIRISPRAIGEICTQLLVPFALGQCAQPLIGGWVTRHRVPLRYVDRASIVLVVYAAFSAGVRDGIWQTVSAWQLGILVLLSVLLVIVLLWLTWAVAAWFGFDHGDRIAVQFCGTKKSLASGLPMAAVLFAGQSVSIIVLPLMVFHQVQLIICSWLATHYGAEAERADQVAARGGLT